MEKQMKRYLRKIGYDKIDIIQSRCGAYIFARDKETQKTYKFPVETLVKAMISRNAF